MGYKMPYYILYGILYPINYCVSGLLQKVSLNVDQGNFYLTETCLNRLKAINPACYVLVNPTKHCIHTERKKMSNYFNIISSERKIGAANV